MFDLYAKGKHQLPQWTSERQWGKILSHNKKNQPSFPKLVFCSFLIYALKALSADFRQVHYKIGTRQRQAPVTTVAK